MNLFEIDAKIQCCFKDGDDVVDITTGEIFDADYIDNLQMEREHKIRNIACWIKNLESDAEQLAIEEKKMAERKNRAKKKAEQLKGYLANALNGEKVQTAEFSIGWRKSKSVIIDDESLIAPEYIKTKIETTVDKVALKSALSNGTVNGCHLEEKNNINIK